MNSEASPTTTQSPTPSSSADAFLPGDCTYPSGAGTRMPSARDTFEMSISLPSGWSLKDNSHTESDFFMVAPTAYPYSPTTIQISGPQPTSPGQTPASYLQVSVANYVSVTGSIEPCTVGRDAAAFLAFTNGASAGYAVLWFHFGDAYLFELIGTGGVDSLAVSDAKAVLASVEYAHNVPPPGYSPSPGS